MNPRIILATIAAVLSLLTPVHAHRLEGLVQSSLVDVLPTEVAVRVTLFPGIDIAPSIRAQLDSNGDGEFSPEESDRWTRLFMARQAVSLNGRSLPLHVRTVHCSPLTEFEGGHAEVVVEFTADLGNHANGPGTIRSVNRYEPIPCFYQCNGLVPKVQGVRVNSHRRDERQQELTLEIEFLEAAAQTRSTAPQVRVDTQGRRVMAALGLVGLIAAGASIGGITGRGRSSSTELS